jgi:demethoxyubiquinone hydroxylase (CLK1/Coq7/Cat5 family)
MAVKGYTDGRLAMMTSVPEVRLQIQGHYNGKISRLADTNVTNLELYRYPTSDMIKRPLQREVL